MYENSCCNYATGLPNKCSGLNSKSFNFEIALSSVFIEPEGIGLFVDSFFNYSGDNFDYCYLN